MKKKLDAKTLFFLGVALVAVVTIASFSFAYVALEGDPEKVIDISGGTQTLPSITFTEDGEGTSLTNTYPVTDEIGLSYNPYMFTVRNDEEKNIDIRVILEVKSDSTLDDTLVNIALNDEVSTLDGEMSQITPTRSDFKKSYVIKTFTLTPGEEKSTSLKVWINDKGTIENAQNKTWSSKITVLPSWPEQTE